MIPFIQQRVVVAAGAALLAAFATYPLALSGAAPPNGKTAPAQSIPRPSIPARTFHVTDYGAKGDGATRDTAALQKAIDACGKAGGGAVIVPAGRFLTGPLTFVSRMELRLEKGATLLLSDDRADFKLESNRYEDAFSARDCHDVAITGEGTIDGQGAAWWARFDKRDTKAPHRPFLVVLTGCERVLVRGITLTRSPMFHLVPQKCRDVTIENIRIVAPQKAPNTDGIDPSGANFRIAGCTFDVGDDCIALKPSARFAPDRPACQNFLIEDCRFLHGHGMSVGGQTPGGLDGLIVRNCVFRGTDAGIRLKAARGSGGVVENILCENLTMQDVKVPVQITSYYNGNSVGGGRIDPVTDPAQPATATTPIWRHIQIRNVTATGAQTAGQIFGLPEMPVDDVSFTNVSIAARKGMEIVHARHMRFTDSPIKAETGPPLTTTDAPIDGSSLP